MSRRNTSPSRFSPNAEYSETLTGVQDVELDCTELSALSVDDSTLHVWSPQKPSKELFPPRVRTFSKSQDEDEPEILLHALLMVPDGKNFSCGPLLVPNVYLNCKWFWCEETARSAVSWGQANPTFNLVQVTPVPLTTKLLERMKNNVMVIEVWQKAGSCGQDRLLGLVKLPLHQFYMSYKDPKIAQLLLQAQYPVLGVDCYMPVIDVFSGSCKGNLRIVLAMGLSEQITSLQRSKNEEYGSLSHFVRPVHLLDHLPHSQTKVKTAQVEMMREHVFTVRLEKVTGLTPLQSTVWGEADCYIQYSFPCQEGNITGKLDENLIESTVNLKSFRSTTTLCIPDPVFSHTENHVLLAPLAVPVQRLLLSSLSSQGLSNGGGVQFEVWCRYYYPNVRDQLVARGMLPLSKLCAMVTMQRQHPSESQMFSLPLIPRTDDHTECQPPPSGLLDVCIQYKHRPVRPEGQSGRGAASRIVTLVVQVHRACGLQAAAKVVSEGDVGLGLLVSEGVKPFVTVQLSFLPESESRCTRTAARTFCPEFDHHMEVSCDLLLHMNSGETCSLAEQLEQGSAVFTVFNKSDREGNNSRSKDVMLGTVKIPLSDLIHKRTGISGWFGLYLTRERSSSQCQHILVGGLEVSICFAHHADRERVVKAAQGLGWKTPYKNIKLQDGKESWEESFKKLSLSFSMPKAWIPLHSLLLPGLSELQRSTYCYFRYKFYDQEAFCSQLKHPCVEEGGPAWQATVTFEGSRTVDLRRTQPLMWYLREEKLEVQIWVTFTKNKTTRPSDSDRLVGSAFIDLSTFTNTSKQKVTLSGVHPLFMRSAADLQGAALRVHITLRESSADTPGGNDSDSQEESFTEQVETEGRPLSPGTSRKAFSQSRQKGNVSRTTPDITSAQHTELSSEETFPVTVAVDRAMHLNLKGCPLAERSEGTPCCCVSYVTADSAEPVSTDVVADTDCPVWEHQQECRLSKDLLVDPQQSLVFKVWHKGEVDRVIGFASVDLSPLLCGLPSVCGWYNITDFSGQCHGQIKVSITPLKGVQDLREKRRSTAEEPVKNSPVLLQSVPLHYQTTAMYSSFPSHISRYTEQQISSPVQTDKLFSERPGESDRHDEHMDNVRLYHQNLQEQTSKLANAFTPSSSFLFSTLRKNLSELDNIQSYFSRKLSTPTFSKLHERDEQRNSETDSSQLLLRTKRLVGEVNTIISGLQANQPETIPVNTQNTTESPTVEEKSTQMSPETVCRAHKVTDESLDVDSSPPSLSTERSGVNTDSEAEEENLCQSSKVSLNDEEQETACGAEDREASDEEEKEEEYEEVVVKPRPLNEVTSLTDRTSPWTSILSEPDLLSLESMEALKESEHSEAGDENREATNAETPNPSDKHQDSLHSCAGSEGDSSDSETEEPAGMKTKKSDSSSGDTRPLTSESHRTQSILVNKEANFHPSPHVEIPNFFLPPHQMEASLRAIRLAPSFSRTPGNTGQTSTDEHPDPPRRVPPQRPNMSPSSMKKETDRIARIFAAKFDE